MSDLAFLRKNASWLVAGGVLAFSSSYGQTFFISIFAEGIRRDFGLSHSQWGGLYGISTLASAAAMVWLGGLTDRYRASRLGPVALIGLALACVAMAMNPYLWALPIIIFALRLFGQGLVTHLSKVSMARWFARSRGKALGISSLGFSLGEAVLPILFVALLASFSWRSLWGLAAVFTVLAIPLLLVLLRSERVPQSMAEEDDSLGMDSRHWTRNEVLRQSLFWFILPSLLAPPAFGTAFFFQQVHVAQSKGWDHIDLVALFPLYTVASILAMLVSGWAVDRFGSGRLLPFVQLPMALGFLCIGLTGSYAGTALGIVLMAMTAGANNTVPSAFWADYFGTKYLGAIKATAMAIMVFGSAIGPALTGALIDTGAPLTAQMPGIAAYIVFGAVMVAIGLARATPRLPLSA